MGIGNGVNRRLGERYGVEGLEVIWVTRHRSDSGGLLRRTVTSVVEQPARLVDVSVSGAAVIAPASHHVHRGSTALIRVDGEEAVVRVERCSPTAEPRLVRYGVQFCRVDASLRARLDAVVDEGPADRHTVRFGGA